MLLKKRKPKKEQKALEKVEKKPPAKKTEIGSVDLNSLMVEAVKQGGIETVERLVALRLQLEQEAARKSYFAALAVFQRDCPIIPRTITVYNKKLDENGKKTVRYRYAPTDVIVSHIKEPLALHGLSYTLGLRQTDKEVTGIFLGHHVDGHLETSDVTVPIMYSDFMNRAQSVISARTMSTRIALCNGLGIATADEDDDGNATGPIPGDEEKPKGPTAKGGRKTTKKAPPKEAAPPEQQERDVTPPPNTQPELEPEPEVTAAQIQAIAERCKAGVRLLVKIKVFSDDDSAKITDSIDDLAAAGNYKKLDETYRELLALHKESKKKEGK